MVTERSLMTARSIFGSMDFFSCGSSALMASTTLMMFAPRCLGDLHLHGRLAVVQTEIPDVLVSRRPGYR